MALIEVNSHPNFLWIQHLEKIIFGARVVVSSDKNGHGGTVTHLLPAPQEVCPIISGHLSPGMQSACCTISPDN